MIVTTAPTRSGITSGQFHGSRSGRRAGVGAGGRSTVLWVRVQPSSSIVSYGRRTSSLRASASRSIGAPAQPSTGGSGANLRGALHQR
jgi:hypothetical protein